MKDFATNTQEIGLAGQAPSNAEIEREKDPVRKDILSAMQRIHLGHPKRVPLGAKSISHLAKEAGIGRHYLYQSHSDLKDRHEYLRDRADQPTEKEAKLQSRADRYRSEIAELRDLQGRTRQEATDWKALTELLARVINTLQEELHQEQIRSERLARRLRKVDEQMGQPSAVVVMHRRSREQEELN